jgi:hypothetical protein
MAAGVWHVGKSLQNIPPDILVGDGPAGTVHPWAGRRKCISPRVCTIHTWLILSLEVLMLALPDRQEVRPCLLAYDRAGQAPILPNNPVLPGAAMCPGLQIDVVVEVVNPRARCLPAVQMLLGEVPG